MPEPVTDQVDQFVALLRQQGKRITTPRRIVIEVLLDAARAKEHLTADEIALRATRSAPTVNVSTIYRTLSALSDLGVVTATSVGVPAAVFHIDPHLTPPGDVHDDAPAAGGHIHGAHAHLRCEICNQITDVDLAYLEPLIAAVREVSGFQIHPDRAVFAGICSACNQHPAEHHGY